MNDGAGEASQTRDERELRLDVAQSVRYHEKRRAFFEVLGKSLEFVALIGSAGAVLALLEIDTKALALVLSAVAALSVVLLILLSPSSRQALHTVLGDRLLDLQARLQEPGLTEPELRRIAQARLEIGKAKLI